MQSFTVTKNPTVDATPDYADGDVIGGKMTLSNVVAFEGDGGVVSAGSVFSAADIAANIPIRVILFNGNPADSTLTENSAPTIHANDLPRIIGILDLSQRLDLGTPVVLFASTPSIPFRLPAGKDLFAVAIAGGAINLAAATDLTFVFGIRRDRDQ